jgi:biotin carboxyl carrier protein
MQRYTVTVGGTHYTIDVGELEPDYFQVQVADQEFHVRLVDNSSLEPAPPDTPPSEPVYQVSLLQQDLCEAQEQADLKAPMPGKVLALNVQPGQRVACGEVVLLLEAMKMKNALHAPQDGVVTDVFVQPGQQVNVDDLLIRFAPVS